MNALMGKRLELLADAALADLAHVETPVPTESRAGVELYWAALVDQVNATTGPDAKQPTSALLDGTARERRERREARRAMAQIAQATLIDGIPGQGKASPAFGFDRNELGDVA